MSTERSFAPCDEKVTFVTALRLDGRDGHLGVRLAMALTLAVTLLGLHLEDVDLLALAGLFDRAGYSGAGNVRSADGELIALAYCQNLVKSNGRAVLHTELLDVDHVSLRYLVLLAASFQNGIHLVFPLFRYRVTLGTAATRFGTHLTGANAQCGF